jgi:hypothetical protein
MPQQKLSPELLAAALQGLEAQKDRIDSQIAQVKRILGVRPKGPSASPEAPKRRHRMSAAASKRIGAAQRKRWAEYRNQKAAAVQEAKEPRRKMSAAARKHIAAVQRKRWAKWRRQKAAAEKT